MNDFDNPTLSIVVPVYNIESYVEECIESVLRQDYTDYELIIIDDGSTDSSPEICDRYNGMYNGRVRVLHTENRGLSAARNAGMDVCLGEYVLFIDGDDVMIKGQLKKVMLAVIDNGAPVTTFHMDGFDNETGEELDLGYGYNSSRIRYGNKAEIMDELLSYEGVPWSTSVNVFRYSLLKDRKLRFRTDAIGVEDCKFFLDLAKVCNSFAYTPVSLMRYRINRSGSIMSTPNVLKLEARAIVYKEWIEYADELISYSGSGENIRTRMADAFFYEVIKQYRKGLDNVFFDTVNRHADILKYATGIKKKVFYRLVKLLGAKTAMAVTVRGKYGVNE